ncbi:MAG TPA: PrgI family protein [Patescibacteria group bacterium]|nr:PrgI family protein [Patescibacteria group bacterium]
MENHPIPQDVTGFKFKLIGSMTVKQFLYLLGFGILTTVCFVLHTNILIKVPLMLLFAGTGAMLAFVPIEGRPMDVMIANFAKTIPSENRYIYKKRGANLASFDALKIPAKPQPAAVKVEIKKEKEEESESNKKALLLSRLRNSGSKPDESEAKFVRSVRSFFDEGGPMPRVITQISADGEPKGEKKIETAPTPTPQPTNPIPAPERPNENDVEALKRQLVAAKEEQAQGGNQEDLAKRIADLEAHLAQVVGENDALSKKVIGYEMNQNQQQEQVMTPGTATEEIQTQQSQNVKFVSPSSTLQAGFPSLPDVPNIVMGIVRDPRNKTLPNILVEVVDQNNIPVRAFKTNSLGQFAAATPLADGTYKVYFEDPQKIHEFEIIQITLDGTIFNPIEVTSVDSREKLRRELFGTAQAQQAPAATA